MKTTKGVINFILFLEEYLLWTPGEIHTLFERLFYVILNSVSSSTPFYQLLIFLNPIFCYFLLLTSVTPVVTYLKSMFDERVEADVLIWIERHGFIRIILTAFLVLFFLIQLLNVLDNPSVTLLALYQNKTLWTIIFIYVILKSFLSEKTWS